MGREGASALQECTFHFGTGQQLLLHVMCRRGPEGKEMLSLTLQDCNDECAEVELLSHKLQVQNCEVICNLMANAERRTTASLQQTATTLAWTYGQPAYF